MAFYPPYGQQPTNNFGVYPQQVPVYNQQPIIPQHQQMNNFAVPPVQQANVNGNSANKIYVTSLQDALARFSTPNTVMTYTTQDEKFEIEIFTDAQGKKTYQMFERIPCQENEKQNTSNNADMSQFALKSEIAEIQGEINKFKQFIKQYEKTQVEGNKGAKNE